MASLPVWKQKVDFLIASWFCTFTSNAFLFCESLLLPCVNWKRHKLRIIFDESLDSLGMSKTFIMTLSINEIYSVIAIGTNNVIESKTKTK